MKPAIARSVARTSADLPVNLLVVDDRRENREALCAILAQPGYSINEAASSSDALRMLLDHEFAVLLLDVSMPDMNGFELTELIRARERNESTPILFVTAHAGESDLVRRGYQVGAVDYLIKPLVPEIVRAKISVFVELYRRRKLLEGALREKEVLLREIHHRVKNNLQVISSLLRLQAASQPPEIKALLLESETRVRSIALVHERLHLSEDMSAIDVRAYATSLATGLLHTFGSTRIGLEVDVAVPPFTIDVAIPCGLIVNELVSNALKYAFPDERSGTISLSIRQEPPGGVVLQVEDDGIGIAPAIDLAHATTTGLQLVTSLCHQLAGTFEVERGRGTRIRARFPLRGGVLAG